MLVQVALLVGLVTVVATLSDVEFRITTQGEACFLKKKVLFHGECHGLLYRGPCQENEVLVLFTSEDKKEMLGCRRCHCCNSQLSIFWPKDQRCHRLSEAQQLCQSPDRELKQNLFDEGECVCRSKPLMLELSETKKNFVDNSRKKGPEACYEPFKQGPCINGYTLQPNLSEKNGICAPDPCLKQNQALKMNEKPFVKFRDTCYQLDTQGPCLNNETVLFVEPDNLNIVCYHPGLSSIVVVNCTESISKCSEETEKPDASQQFVDEVTQSFTKKRVQRRARSFS